MQWVLVALCVMVAGGAAALAVSRWPRLSTLCGALGTVGGCAIALAGVASMVLLGDETSFLAAWDVPYGSFSLELDPLSTFFALPVLVLSALAATSGTRMVVPFFGVKSVGGLWFFFNLLVAGMLVVVLARNAVLFLVAWEVMSLAAFFLITFRDEEQEVRAAGRTFLIATHLGTAFLLVMFLLLGAQSGSLEFSDFTLHDSATPASVLFVLALIGFGTKAGLMPLHVWLPESYPVAPSFVSAVMSGAMSKLGIYGLLRILLSLGPAEAWWGWLLVAAGAASAILGILSALAQRDLLRLLAYSSVENMGIIAMGLGLGVIGTTTGSPTLAVLGYAGALMHVLNHGLFKSLLFLGAGAVVQATDTRELDRLGGLLKRMPWTGAAMLLGATAIAGLPPLNGFASEFMIYSAAFSSEGLLAPVPTSVLSLAVIGSLALVGGLASYTFAKAFGIAFLGEPRSRQAADAHGLGPRVILPVILLAVGCLVVGLLSPQVFAALTPLLAQLTREAPQAASARVELAVAPLAWVARMSCILILVVGGLAVVRRLLLMGREVAVSSTWGCGYSRSTSRIQYTSSSFAQLAVEFFSPLIYTRKLVSPPLGLFPKSASLSTESEDLSKDFIYQPLFGSIGWVLSKLRWLQHGRVHLYVLYVGCTIVALLVWYVGTELGPVTAPPTAATVQQPPE